MEEFLSNLYSISSVPVWSAFLLGLMTAISPCPLASNITALGYISRDVEKRNKVFYNGIIYTVGRAFSYTVLAFILYLGADRLKISFVFQQYGERILGPLLIIIGLFMLGVIRLNFFRSAVLSNKFQDKEKFGWLSIFLLGVIFALAFCPYSGVLYFGMLIPMTIQSVSGLLLPVVFAIATGIPVIIFAWVLAYSVGEVGKLYNRIKTFELWFRRVVSILFIAVGTYYSILVWIN